MCRGLFHKYLIISYNVYLRLLLRIPLKLYDHIRSGFAGVWKVPDAFCHQQGSGSGAKADRFVALNRAEGLDSRVGISYDAVDQLVGSVIV